MLLLAPRDKKLRVVPQTDRNPNGAFLAKEYRDFGHNEQRVCQVLHDSSGPRSPQIGKVPTGQPPYFYAFSAVFNQII